MSKPGIVIIVCLLVAGVVGFYAKKYKTTANQLATERVELQTKITNLEAQLHDTLQQPLHAETEIVSLDTVDPDAIVARLNTLDPDRRKQIREAQFCFQQLVELGTNSLPAIRDYFISRNNVEFFPAGTKTISLNLPAEALAQLPAEAQNISQEIQVKEEKKVADPKSVIPFSTRLGLVDVLRDIATSSAYDLLSQVIQVALDPSELIYMSAILQEVNPELYTTVTIQTARNMLAGNTLTNTEREALYDLLIQLGDTEVATLTGGHLMNEGKLDAKMLDLMLKDQGANAIYAIYDAYKTANIGDKMQIVNKTMDYVGTNSMATEMFDSVFNAQETVAPIRSTMLLGLGGINTSDGFNSSNYMTPETASARLALLDQLEEKYGNSGNINRIVREQLDYYSNPSAYSEAPAINATDIAADIISDALFSADGNTEVKVIPNITVTTETIQK